MSLRKMTVVDEEKRLRIGMRNPEEAEEAEVEIGDDRKEPRLPWRRGSVVHSSRSLRSRNDGWMKRARSDGDDGGESLGVQGWIGDGGNVLDGRSRVH